MLWEVSLPANSISEINLTLRQGTPGSLWLRPEFWRTGTATQPPVLTPRPPVVQPPAAQPPVVVPPSEPATVFPPPSQPQVTPPPPITNGATLFGQQPSLSVRIEPSTFLPLVAGNPVFQIRVANTGTINARNVLVVIPLPPALRNQDVNAGWMLTAVDGTAEWKPGGWDGRIDESNHRAQLQIPTLLSGDTALFVLEYPRTNQGYDISCSVYVDGQRVIEESQRMMPGL